MRQVDLALYLVCDGCRRIATFHGLDVSGAIVRARAAGWAVRPASDHCRECDAKLVRHQG